MATPILDRLDQLLSTNTRAAQTLQNIQEQMATLINRVTRLGQLNTAGPKQPKKPKEAEGFDFAKFAGKVAKFAGAVSLAVGGLLALAALPAVLTAAAIPFVRALNPGIVAAFEQQLENLNATIGYGLEPIVAQAAYTVREWAGLLLPAVRELRPVVAQIAAAVGGYMTGAVSAFVSALQAGLKVVAPFAEFFAKVASANGQLLEVYAALLTALSDLFGVFGFIRDGLDLLATVIRGATVATAQLAAMFLKLVGAGDTLQKFRDALAKRIEDRKKPPGELVAAPKDVNTTGIEEIARKMGERAFAATAGGAGARSETDLLEDILKDVTAIAGSNLDWKTLIRDGVSAALDRTPGGATIKAVAPVVTTVSDASATSGDRFRAGRAAGGLAGGTLAVGAGAAADLFNWVAN